MKEFIDDDTQIKMMALVMCGIRYIHDEYLVYAIRRSNEEVNIFVSKLFKTSSGYIVKNDFLNGEKEVIVSLIQRILNRESIDTLNKDGYTLFSNIELASNLSFDVNNCYVSTVSKKLLLDCLKYYNLVNEDILNAPMVNVIDDKRKFNEGFVFNISVIIFGVFILVFSIYIVFSLFFK